MESSTSVREELARRSEEWNVDNDNLFNALWPEYKVKVQQRRKQEKEQERKQKASGVTDESVDAAAAAVGALKLDGREEAGKAAVAQEGKREGGGKGGGNRGGRLPLGMDKLMVVIALASVAFGVAVLYTYQ